MGGIKRCESFGRRDEWLSSKVSCCKLPCFRPRHAAVSSGSVPLVCSLWKWYHRDERSELKLYHTNHGCFSKSPDNTT